MPPEETPTEVTEGGSSSAPETAAVASSNPPTPVEEASTSAPATDPLPPPPVEEPLPPPPPAEEGGVGGALPPPAEEAANPPAPPSELEQVITYVEAVAKTLSVRSPYEAGHLVFEQGYVAGVLGLLKGIGVEGAISVSETVREVLRKKIKENYL